MSQWGWSLPTVRERARECQRVEFENASPSLWVLALTLGLIVAALWWRTA